MPFTKLAQTEPIAGYRLLEPLGCGGFGEVWKCEAPGSLFKAIKFVYGNLKGVEGGPNQAHEELQAILRIKDLHHPFLLSIDRVECLGSELMIVTEIAEKNLHELLLEYQQRGQQGIPREELLHYIGEAAEVLDLMNMRHGLQHLDVKPRNFFLVSNHVKVGDFGLVTSHAGAPSAVKLGAVTPIYASPEVFLGNVSRSSDQYSLACSYMELLTGQLPFAGKNSRELLMQHLKAKPDLSPLPEADRALVARALAKEPEDRFPSCLDFVKALKEKPGSANQRPQAGDKSAGQLEGELQRAPIARASQAAAPRSASGRKGPDSDTQQTHKTARTKPVALAGYQMLENQASSLLADAWRAIAPDGRLCTVKFVYGLPAQSEEAIRRFKAMEHPGLVRLEVVQTDPGCLVLVGEGARITVRDRWQKCHAQKLPGIPRGELLAYLRTAAEVVDYLYQQHSIHHLALNPRVLVLNDGGLQIADFGLAHLFWLPAGQEVANHNARYSAPELFDDQVSRTTDQYSLALLFAELLTSHHPFTGLSRAAATMPRNILKPDLSRLADADREIIAKALDPDPARRYPACVDLIRALQGDENAAGKKTTWSDLAFQDTMPTVPDVVASPTANASETLRKILADLIIQAGGQAGELDALAEPVLSHDGCELIHQFRTGLPIGSARTKLEEYRQQCNGQPVREDDKVTEFHVAAPTCFWRQWIGRPPGLDVRVQFARPHSLSATPIDVSVQIRAVNCAKKRAHQLVQDLGVTVLEGLRTFLLVNSEKRTQDRILWPHPVQVRPVESDGTVGAPMTCRGKDISASGIGFYLPHELPTSHVLIELPGSATSPALRIPATLVRAHRCADGWYDVGALFRLVSLKQSMPELSLARAN
jgi:serine/threonine protein kinase